MKRTKLSYINENIKLFLEKLIFYFIQMEI